MKSTHNLLLKLFIDEVGLFGSGPCSYEVQYCTVVDNFEDIRSSNSDSEKFALSAPFESVFIDRKDELILFHRLYSAINKMNTNGVDEDKVIRRIVYPEINLMLARLPDLAKLICKEFYAYTDDYPKEVGEYMAGNILLFGVDVKKYFEENINLEA